MNFLELQIKLDKFQIFLFSTKMKIFFSEKKLLSIINEIKIYIVKISLGILRKKLIFYKKNYIVLFIEHI